MLAHLIPIYPFLDLSFVYLAIHKSIVISIYPLFIYSHTLPVLILYLSSHLSMTYLSPHSFTYSFIPCDHPLTHSFIYSLYPFIHLYIYLSTYPSITYLLSCTYLSNLCPFMYLSIHSSTYPPTHSSTHYPTTHLSIHPSTHL